MRSKRAQIRFSYTCPIGERLVVAHSHVLPAIKFCQGLFAQPAGRRDKFLQIRFGRRSLAGSAVVSAFFGVRPTNATYHSTYCTFGHFHNPGITGVEKLAPHRTSNCPGVLGISRLAAFSHGLFVEAIRIPAHEFAFRARSPEEIQGIHPQDITLPQSE